MEEWRKIPGFPLMYEVSSIGRIRRLESTYWRMLHGKLTKHLLPAKFISLRTKNRKGYIDVRINNRLWRLHRLVAMAFVPNPQNLPQVNHKNAIKTDNNFKNLEWCTNQENRNHMVRLKLHIFGSKCPRAILKESDIPKIRNFIKEGISQSQIAKKFGVSPSCIQAIADGNNWKHI